MSRPRWERSAALDWCGWGAGLGAANVYFGEDGSVRSDFLGDHSQLIAAYSHGDETPAHGYVSGSALLALAGEISSDSGNGLVERISMGPVTTTVFHSADPRDPSLTTGVHQVRYRTVEYVGARPGAASREEVQKVDDRFWMRRAGGRWVIADLVAQDVATTATDEYIGGGGLALTVVGLLLVSSVIAAFLPGRREELSGGPGPPQGNIELETPRLRIRLIGTLSVTTAEGEELTTRILDRRVGGYLWLFLIAQVVAGKTGWMMRGSLGEGLYPRLPRARRPARPDRAPGRAQALLPESFSATIRSGARTRSASTPWGAGWMRWRWSIAPRNAAPATRRYGWPEAQALLERTRGSCCRCSRRWRSG